MTYAIIFIVLLALELSYFKIADRFNIIDKPNERSSHKRVVLRGGGIIFLFGIWLWSLIFGFQYPLMLVGVTLAAGISFVDDIHSLPDSLRMVVQFVAMALMFYEVGILRADMWWIVILALIFCVGIVNAFNFMDGINGITGGYSLAVLIPLLTMNENMKLENGEGFIDASLLWVMLLAVVVFCFFNFREKAKCFAGDVGSIGIAFILMYALGCLIVKTGDLTYFVFLVVYGVDTILTICHRIMLKEHLGQAHRKHCYQLMANEMKIPHTMVSLFYAVLQLAISFGLILSDDHWAYAIVVIVALCIGYLSFMKEYYHLHEEYLASLGNGQRS